MTNLKEPFSLKCSAIRRKLSIMEISLRPKNIIVIGGGSGIGYATAQKLLDGGADSIILASRNIKKLENATKLLNYNSNQKIYVIEFNISEVSSHLKKINEIQSMLGESKQVDGLVISSGINFNGANWKGFNISETDWDNVMNVNLKGVFLLIRTFSNLLHSKGVKGNICVVSSISAHRDLLSVYQVTKNAISGIVHAYGKHLCERGIVLNCVEPGTTNTDMMKELKDYTDGVRTGKEWGDNSIRRLIRPEEIAEIIFFLMSNLGETMAGSCVLAGGGCKGLAR